MTRRPLGLILTLTLGLLVAPLAADAPPPGKVPLLGILSPDSYPSEAERQRSHLWHGLHELGWHEGQNMAVERRYAESQLPVCSANKRPVPVRGRGPQRAAGAALPADAGG
jgi:hypothetical protein